MTHYSHIKRPFPLIAASITLASACLIGAGATSVSAAVPPPTIDYTFDGNLTDSGGGSSATPTASCSDPGPPDICIASSSFGSDGNGGYWQWTSTALDGGGLRILSNSVLASTYTAILKFSFNGLSVSSGYSKIMDYLDRNLDTGFYFHNDKIYFYNLGDRSTQTFAADEVIDLIIVRDGTTDRFVVYLRGADGSLGAPVIDITDPTDQSVFATSGSNSVIGLFYDDDATDEEGSPGGKAYDFRFWDGIALTPEQLAELFGIGGEEPSYDFDDYRLPEPTVAAETLPNTGSTTLMPLAALAGLLVSTGVAIALKSRRLDRI
jgi:LPXTG-motif cell wall-anchored protein